MPWNLLILPLVGGYYIISRCNFFKFKQQHLANHRLIFDSIIAGVILLALTSLVRNVTGLIWPKYINCIYNLFPLKIAFFGTSLFSFLFAIFYTEISNRFICKDVIKQMSIANRRVGNTLDQLLRLSFEEQKLLEVTLNSDKVYIILVKELAPPQNSKYIRVIPFLSGFRDGMKKLNFTTEYISVYDEIMEENNISNHKDLDFDLIITRDNIVSVSYFDLKMYEKFNSPLDSDEE